MNKELKVLLIQSELVWENPAANRKHFSDILETTKEDVDIIVLPEMFTSGFTMNATKVAETMSGSTITWMKEQSKIYNAAITGSIVIIENDAFYNRLLFVTPDGNIQYYDKKHTFTLAGEHKTYKAGDELLLIDYRGWKIKPLVCYDLRFPVWARNSEDYDLLIYVANWPKVRVSAWDALLKARAIENMSYCIGVNRVGLDGNEFEYSGHSAAYDVLGERLDHIPSGQAITEVVTLQKDHILTYREKLGFLKDRDSFTLV